MSKGPMNPGVMSAHASLGKRLLFLAAFLLVLMSPLAQAGGYGHGWSAGFHYGYGPGYGYRPRYGYGPPYGHGYRHGYGYAAGAFVLGGLLGYAISSSNQPRYVVARQPVYVQSRSRPVYSSQTAYDSGAATTFSPGSYPRYYLRDADGNCYLVNTRENGDETWTAVPAVNCQ